jgi:hypothetical protein
MSEQVATILAPRRLLTTVANPSQRLDYVIAIRKNLTLGQPPEKMHLNIRYIPDLLILDQKAISPYIEALEGVTWENPESLAQTLLDDLCNELVPRWIEVSLQEVADNPELQAFDYTVIMEDSQPGWSNPRLLSRLMPLRHG